MHEHIGHGDARDPITSPHQMCGIPSQGRRVAGDIKHAWHRRRRQGPGGTFGPLAWRIEHHHLGADLLQERCHCPLTRQIGLASRQLQLPTVGTGIGTRVGTQALDHRRAPLHRDHPCPGGGQRQAEIADTGKQVKNHAPGKIIEPAECRRNHLSIDLLIGLQEVTGSDAQLEVLLGPGHSVAQPRGRCQPLQGGGITPCQPAQMDPMFAGEDTPGLAIDDVLLELADHQGAALIAGQQLQMTHLAWRLQHHQLTVQGGQQGIELRHQDGAVRDIHQTMAMACAEPEVQTPLGIQFHAQPSTAPIALAGTGQQLCFPGDLDSLTRQQIDEDRLLVATLGGH